MKSLSTIVDGMTPTLTENGTALSIALTPRATPLESIDIEKMDNAISRYFDIRHEPVYGYVPVKDERGEVIRQEYDITGWENSFIRTGEPPQQLKDALLRPAERRHVIYHLTRLAAHRRDTRGEEALTAVIEDIAMDLTGVSEWSVIVSCREFRQKPNIWYPTTCEIIESIRRSQRKIEAMFRDENADLLGYTKKLAIENRQRAEERWENLPQTEWLPEHFDIVIGQAEKVLAGIKESPTMGLDPLFWQNKIIDLKAKKIEAEERFKI